MPATYAKLPVVLVLENLRSLYNIGALFRTADAVNLEKIILVGGTATPPRREIEKTALGASHSVAWEYRRSVFELTAYNLVALELTPQASDLFETQLTLPLALVVGHERIGISQEALALCQRHVCLPMHGSSAHSLNAATAGSVALYELARRHWYNI